MPVAYDIKTGEMLDESGRITKDIRLVKGYRLPTEAEWEFAARGGKKSNGFKYSGSNDPAEVSCGNHGHTIEVGTKAPNELGLYDMTGNVWEFCTDSYNKYSGITETNPCIYNKTIDLRAIRGGSWTTSNMPVYRRDSVNKGSKSNAMGFRIAKSACIEDE